MSRGALEQRVIADPTKWIPMAFPVQVEIREQQAGVNVQPGDQGRGQVAINDRTFLLRYITHQIIARTPDQNIYQQQDGLYRIDWSEYEQVRFYKGSIPMADIMFGSVRDGNWIWLPAPVTLPGNQTLHVNVINEAIRTIPQMEIQVIFHGLQHRGSISQTGGPGGEKPASTGLDI
jgi:hypothetical protein